MNTSDILEQMLYKYNTLINKCDCNKRGSYCTNIY